MMLLRFILFVSICFLAPAGSVWGQNTDREPLTFSVRPEVGQAWIVNIWREKVVDREDKVVSRANARILALMEISDVSEHGYEISWKTRSVSDGAVVIDPDSVDPRLLTGMTIGVRLDKSGQPLELKDWDRVRANLSRNLGKHSVDWDKSEYFRNLTDGWDSTTAAPFLFGDLVTLSVCQSVEHVAESRPVELVTGLFGGAPIVTIETYIPQGIDGGKDTVRFRVERVTDPEATARAVRRFAEETAERTGGNAGNLVVLLDRFKLENNFSVDCTIDLVTGFATDVVNVVDIRVGNEHARLERRITLLPISGNR